MEHWLAVWVCTSLVAEGHVFAEADVTVAKGRRGEGAKVRRKRDAGKGIALCVWRSMGPNSRSSEEGDLLVQASVYKTYRTRLPDAIMRGSCFSRGRTMRNAW